MRKMIAGSFIIILVLCGIFAVTQDIIQAELPPQLIEDLDYIREQEGRISITFSHKNFFYSQPISVSISSTDPDAPIYYTLDGSDPTSSSKKYSDPIVINAGGHTNCTVIKAVTLSEGNESAIATHSYFIDPNIESRFSSYVFSLSTDESNLYDYENGILVPGKIYDDYMDEGGGGSIWHRPANYKVSGRESERPVYVEAFTADGSCVISQSSGLRVHGGATRYTPQKSLRIIARKEYDPRSGKFKYNFFPELLSRDKYETPVLSYDALVLHNGGNDHFYSRIRTQLISTIAWEAGFSAVVPVESAAVFLNGMYYGQAWLQSQINEALLADLFASPEETFDIIEGGNTHLGPSSDEIKADFSRILALAKSGLTNELSYQRFQESVDVENMLFYYAIQSYICNIDWPTNNMKIWRYMGESDEGSPAELDGRWRFMLYDMELSMMHPFKHSITTPDIPSITNLINDDGNGDSPLLTALLARPDAAEKFAGYMCDMTFSHLSEENVRSVMDGLYGKSLEEMKYYAEYHGGSGFNTWTESYIPDITQNIFENREIILYFLRERSEYILNEMRTLFGYTSMYQVVVDGPAKINTITSGKGIYFVENRVPVTPMVPHGKEFDRWIVNGREVYEENIIVSAEDAEDGIVDIRLVLKDSLSPLAFIPDSVYSDNDGICGFSMTNPTQQPQKLDQLYLSDNPEDLKKWMFPKMTVPAEGKLDIVGKSYKDEKALLKIGLHFNPEIGEVIFLSDESGKILEYMAMK